MRAQDRKGQMKECAAAGTVSHGFGSNAGGSSQQSIRLRSLRTEGRRLAQHLPGLQHCPPEPCHSSKRTTGQGIKQISHSCFDLPSKARCFRLHGSTEHGSRVMLTASHIQSHNGGGGMGPTYQEICCCLRAGALPLPCHGLVHPGCRAAAAL